MTQEKRGDDGLIVCGSCIEQERLREKCAPILLRAKTPDKFLSFFLFAKNQLQVGRDKNPLELIRQVSNSFFLSEKNDIIISTSTYVSGRHMGLRIAAEGKECLKIYDCGTSGEGSGSGVWLEEERIPKTCWHKISDNAKLFLGKFRENKGISLSLKVFRNSEDGNRIDSVLIQREDGLKECSCVIVHRQASVGVGDYAVSLGESESQNACGKIFFDESSSSFMYKKLPGNSNPFTIEPGSKTVESGIEIVFESVPEDAFITLA